MPTLAVPTRRPFTEQGKALGRLKLLVAGDTGIGKSSLIRAIIQSCEHITHVDPPAECTSRHRMGYSIDSVDRHQTADRSRLSISETFASTKPYPAWWNLVDDVSLSPRRQSLGDSVLDRNICFVDTTGYNTTNDSIVAETSHYIDQHLRRSMMSGLDESNVLSTISNGGGVLVDAVIFMIPGCGLSSRDLDLIRHLEPKTSIIPVLAQADTMTSAQIDCSKELILRQLAKANLAPFIFHDSTPTVAEVPIVFAVSSHSSTDEENMDASILMNPDYIPPLAPSDLTALLEHIFSIEGSSRLRHATARKLTAK
ncbi:hypothetical protein VD0002_g2504 [Verticillium dahliae]|nr:hypothetical protein VD0002_g2504 [Verticillium dahliae]